MASPPTVVELEHVRSALAAAAERVASLVRSLPELGQAVAGSEWTVGEVAAHLAVMSEFYAANVAGSAEPFVDVSDIARGSLARSNAARLRAEPERDLVALADRLSDGLSRIVGGSAGRSGEEVVTWNGRELPIAVVLGIALGECLLHGLDLAGSTGREWDIGRPDARLVLASVLPELPLLVDPEATSDVRASYDVRVRGGVRLTVRVDHGRAMVDGPGDRADCHVSADPVALLLIAYGRRSLWGPALSGKVVVWGRRPWLGPRLIRYFLPPR